MARSIPASVAHAGTRDHTTTPSPPSFYLPRRCQQKAASRSRGAMNRIVAKLIPLARRFPGHDSKPGDTGRTPAAAPPTVLILTASTGAGHNSVAEGLAEA